MIVDLGHDAKSCTYSPTLEVVYDAAARGFEMKICSYLLPLSVLCIFLLTLASAAATIINVPADQPTIQAAINVAVNGDTVLVAPGTYLENISFLGKAITVTSAKGPKLTIIDGQQKNSVVIFENKETLTSVLNGFTIQNGNATTLVSGGGISMPFSSSATITGNIITGNQGCTGGGIYADGGSPVVKGNVIEKNVANCGGGSGGGIELDATYGPQIIGNVIQGNTSPGGGGAGIALEGLFQPAVIQNNIIRNNQAHMQGGGLYAFNSDYALVIQNLVIDNTAVEGAGADWSVPMNEQGPTMVNNTFSGNKIIPNNGNCSTCLSQGSAVFLNGFYSNSILDNNLFIAEPGQSALYCSSEYSSTPPVTMNNDAYSLGGTGFGLACSGSTGTSGNISVDPLFVGTSNFRLKGGSPAIDAGDNSAPDLPSTDLAGNPRIINGNDLPTAIIDMGAYEFVPVTLLPKALGFGSQAVGSTTTKTVTLTNEQDKSLSISSKTVPAGYKVSGCGTSVPAFSSCSLTVTFQPTTAGSFKGTLTMKDDAGNSPQTIKLSGVAD
jgi:parallel beta-helix repeat protein